MKITIDTKADSKDEIKKVVQLLLALSKEGSREEIRENTGLFSVDKKEETTNAFVNLFGGNEEKTRTEKQSDSGSSMDFNRLASLMSRTGKEEKKEDEPKLIFL